MSPKLKFFAVILMTAAVGSAQAQPACPVDPAAYPAIGEQEMAQLRWTLNLASRPLDDFTNLEGLDQFGMHAYRYQIAFMGYALALEQYHKIPAYPGLIQPSLNRLIEKILEKPVWEYWARISQGIPAFEPKRDKPYPEAHDPVGDRNIMYSGHIGHLIGLYEMLYRDRRWDQPGSIVFAWSDSEKSVYNHDSLEKVMWRQMEENPWHSIACEPNAVFPECNQHPVLSFLLYDHVHGTHLAEVNAKFLEFFLSREFIDPKSHETADYYLIKQETMFSARNPRAGNAYDLISVPVGTFKLLGKGSSTANGWTGAFMHAWEPEFIARHYPYQRDAHLRQAKEEMLRLDRDNPSFLTLKYGFFAAYAEEMGDPETADKLLAFADQKYQHEFKDGMLYYPWDKGIFTSHLTGHLLFLARANVKDGLWKLHQEPWGEAHFQEPLIEAVDYPSVLVRRAIYDGSKKALIVSTQPGSVVGTGLKPASTTAFRVRNLTSGRNYGLWQDGKFIKQLKGQDSITLEAPLDGPHDLVIAEI